MKRRWALVVSAGLLGACGGGSDNAGEWTFVGRGQLFDQQQCEAEWPTQAVPPCDAGDFRLSGVTWDGVFTGFLTDVRLESTEGDPAVLRSGSGTWRPERGLDPDFACGGTPQPETGRTASARPDPDQPAPVRILDAADLGVVTLQQEHWVSVRDVPGCIEETGTWTAAGGELDGRSGGFRYLWDGRQHRLDLTSD